MAKNQAVWGIDIGQCALKALRCTLDADGETVVADKYDFIEYPKILSQADAVPEEMIQEALTEFLSRNDVVGDSVAISVSGQAGLSRFFKPPPIEAKKLPKIVEYEVKQQIPFPIEDVIWDWQQLGGSIVDGRTVDAEVGLFAMKRDAVFRALQPFEDVGVNVDFVQLSPLSIFNVVCHDIIDDLPNPEDFDPENPPESMVVMSMGTDTTDLIVSNGIKLWLRSIPIGGNHFTKQLSREMKLTQAKAEHLKRNARQSENPKAVFQAMRQVFNDLVNEVQRSLTFFQSMDKTAEVSKLVLLGNAAKLPGLRQFLNKQLEIDIAKISEFKNLTGADVVNEKAFTNNLLSFAPCYGLCLQGLKRGKLNTNLLPVEIVTERIVRAKKPWILASVSLLMMGCLIGWACKGNAWWKVHEEYTSGGVNWKQGIREVDKEADLSGKFLEDDKKLHTRLTRLNLLGEELVSASEDRTTWIEILSALHQSLPKDELEENQEKANPGEHPYSERTELYIDHIETKFFENLNDWLTVTKPIYETQLEATEEELMAFKLLMAQAKEKAQEADAAQVLQNKQGWVIEIKGHHYFNSREKTRKRIGGRNHLINYFLRTLIDGDVEIPGENGRSKYKFTDFGIYYPTITSSSAPTIQTITFSNPITYTVKKSADAEGEDGDSDDSKAEVEGEKVSKKNFEVERYDFVIQMAWVPRTPSERDEVKAEREAAEAAKPQDADAAADAETDPIKPDGN